MSIIERLPGYFVRDIAAYALQIAAAIGQPRLQCFHQDVDLDSIDRAVLSLSFDGRRCSVHLQQRQQDMPAYLSADAKAAIKEFFDSLAEHIEKIYIMWVTDATHEDALLRHTVIAYDGERGAFLAGYMNRFANELDAAATMRGNIERALQSEEYGLLPYEQQLKAQEVLRDACRLEENRKGYDRRAAMRECEDINLKLRGVTPLYFVVK